MKPCGAQGVDDSSGSPNVVFHPYVNDCQRLHCYFQCQGGENPVFTSPLKRSLRVLQTVGL